MRVVAIITDKKVTTIQYPFSQNPDEPTVEKIKKEVYKGRWKALGNGTYISSNKKVKFSKSANQLDFSSQKNRIN